MARSRPILGVPLDRDSASIRSGQRHQTAGEVANARVGQSAQSTEGTMSHVPQPPGLRGGARPGVGFQDGFDPLCRRWRIEQWYPFSLRDYRSLSSRRSTRREGFFLGPWQRLTVRLLAHVRGRRSPNRERGSGRPRRDPQGGRAVTSHPDYRRLSRLHARA